MVEQVCTFVVVMVTHGTPQKNWTHRHICIYICTHVFTHVWRMLKMEPRAWHMPGLGLLSYNPNLVFLRKILVCSSG